MVLSGNDSDASQEMADSGSVGSVGRRKYHKKKFPRSEMKTRGAKLPNFALQMRAGHWTRKQWKTSSDDASYIDTRSSSSVPRCSVPITVDSTLRFLLMQFSALGYGKSFTVGCLRLSDL